MRLFVLFRAHFRFLLVQSVNSYSKRKNNLNINAFFKNFNLVKPICYYKMPKRKHEDVTQTEAKAEDKTKTTKKSSAKPRGKVSKNPSVESKSDKSSETSSISNDKETVEKPKAKGRLKKKDSEIKATKATKTKDTKTSKAVEIKKIEVADNSKEPDVRKGRATKSKAPAKIEKKLEKVDEEEEDSEHEEEIPKKKGRAATKTQAKESDKPAKIKNKTSTSYQEINFNTCDSKNGKQWNFKISNWNVDGIRAWLKKGGLDYINYEKPDIFCLQETKCSEKKLPKEVQVEGYHVYWQNSVKDGYAGVGLYSKTEPLRVTYGIGNDEHDAEGRIITAEYKKFYVISVYVPNAGRGLVTLDKRMDWNNHFKDYIAELDKKKPVIICGDMNVAHNEIDLANPKTNTKNAGFTKEEREGMTNFLGDGYVDTYRHFYPQKTQAYTFWSYFSNARAKDIGWRLDYFIVSKRLIDIVCDNVIRSDVFGSDHCPITLFLSV